MAITDKQAKELAEDHWEFLEKWLHMIYVDAGIHFFKHGYEAHIMEEIVHAKPDRP